MPVTLVNPLDETSRAKPKPARRLAELNGKTLGLLDISKPGGSIFLNHLERSLTQRYGVARIVRITKPTFTRRAPEQVIEELLKNNCDAVIEALAD
jgi:hypothetical protein